LRIHRPIRSKRMEIVLQDCHGLHPSLETLKRSPSCSGGSESRAGRATSSIRTHGPHMYPHLPRTFRHDPDDSWRSQRCLAPHSVHPALHRRCHRAVASPTSCYAVATLILAQR
jgi:hypothetical protein